MKSTFTQSSFKCNIHKHRPMKRKLIQNVKSLQRFIPSFWGLSSLQQYGSVTSPPHFKRFMCRDRSRRNHEHLSRKSYWKSRYKNSLKSEELSFDWFLGPKEVCDVVKGHLKEVHENCFGTHSIQEPSTDLKLNYLELGCGVSDVPYHLAKTSQVPLHLILLDFVEEALQYQQRRLSKVRTRHDFTAVCGEATHLPFKTNSLHVVVDKGTMDAVLKDATLGHETSNVIVSEIRRVLTPHGRFIQISDEDPDSRLGFLENIWTNMHGHKSILNQTETSVSGQSLTPTADDTRCSRHVDEVKKGSPISEKMGVDKSFWCFSCIETEFGQEYFVYWRDKI